MSGLEQRDEIARLFVAGRPRTKGHIQPVHIRGTNGRPCQFGGGKDRPELQEWMRILGRSIQSQLGIELKRTRTPEGKVKVKRMDADPYSEPVEIDCYFRFDRQLSIAEAAETGQVWDSHDTPWPTAISIGDEDTLRRGALDALVKSGVILDDRLSVGGLNYKRWCRAGEVPGVLIIVKPSPDPDSIP